MIIQSQSIADEPSPQELQAWANEAQSCMDSGDYPKARATVTALRSYAALKARVAELEAELESCRACRDKIDCLSRGAGS